MYLFLEIFVSHVAYSIVKVEFLDQTNHSEVSYMRKVYIIILSIIIVFLLYFIDSVVGNPMNKILATSYAKQFLQTQFHDQDYTLESIGFNYDTKMYDYIVTRQNDDELSYTLSINSSISNRTVDEFKLHPAVVNEALSTRLSSAAKPHVTNIVHNILPEANVSYQLYAPKSMPETTVWSPGFTADLNAIIQITLTTDRWDEDDEETVLQEIKDQFATSGIHYSTVSIRVTEEYIKEGITYFKTVFKTELHESDEI